MRNRRILLTVAALTIAFANWGCTGPSIALGPQIQTRYVVMHPGRPLQVLENKTVKGRALEDNGSAVEQDIGGWVAMPPDHWETVKKELEKK